MIDVSLLNRVHFGYCPAALKMLPDKSVHCVVTSPPYWGVRVYEGVEPQTWADGTTSCLGLEESPFDYVKHLVEIFAEIKRVMRDDAVLWINIGDTFAATTKGSGGHNPKQDSNRGSWMEDRKGKIPEGLKPKDLCGIPWRVAFALQDDGWYLRSDIIWQKMNPMPEPVTDRPTRAHEYVFLMTKSARYFYDHVAIMEDIKDVKYKTKFGGTKYPGQDGIKSTFSGNKYDASTMIGKNKRSVWTVNTDKSSESHFATFPSALIEPMILAGTSEKGCCPNCGSQWERIVEKGEIAPEPENRMPLKRLEQGQAGNLDKGNMGFRASKLSGQEMNDWKRSHPDQTTGWQPTCKCSGLDGDSPGSDCADENNWPSVPCVVLDPFAGSGTTVATAMGLKRYGIGFDASRKYVEEIAALKIERKKMGITLKEQKAGQKTLFD